VDFDPELEAIAETFARQTAVERYERRVARLVAARLEEYQGLLCPQCGGRGFTRLKRCEFPYPYFQGYCIECAKPVSWEIEHERAYNHEMRTRTLMIRDY
jgi:hypothetical protein